MSMLKENDLQVASSIKEKILTGKPLSGSDGCFIGWGTKRYNSDEVLAAYAEILELVKPSFEAQIGTTVVDLFAAIESESDIKEPALRFSKIEDDAAFGYAWHLFQEKATTYTNVDKDGYPITFRDLSKSCLKAQVELHRLCINRIISFFGIEIKV